MHECELKESKYSIESNFNNDPLGCSRHQSIKCNQQLWRLLAANALDVPTLSHLERTKGLTPRRRGASAGRRVLQAHALVRTARSCLGLIDAPAAFSVYRYSI